MEVDKPEAGENELLVRVEATTVNRTDCGYRAAKPFILRFFTGLRRPKPTRWVLGTEFAGEVEAVGSRVTSFEVGDSVFGYVEGRFGAHAEYVTIAEDASVATMPANSTLRGGRRQHGRLALRAREHPGGEDQRRPTTSS